VCRLPFRSGHLTEPIGCSLTDLDCAVLRPGAVQILFCPSQQNAGEVNARVESFPCSGEARPVRFRPAG
jgi:hypothetical protein